MENKIIISTVTSPSLFLNDSKKVLILANPKAMNDIKNIFLDSEINESLTLYCSEDITEDLTWILFHISIVDYIIIVVDPSTSEEGLILASSLALDTKTYLCVNEKDNFLNIVRLRNRNLCSDHHQITYNVIEAIKVL